MSEAQEVVYEEVEDARTGEIIPIKPEPPKPPVNTVETQLELNKVGTLVLDDNAQTVLAEPLDEKDVKIRPDGLVYLPWTWYAERLNRAFGRLGWGLIPQSAPISKDMGGNMVLVVWGHWLVVRGVPVGFEMGETAYRTNNNQMSFGDAAAGAKSNSLARNCKMLGMSLQLWDSDWVNAWRKNYAETYKNPKNDKTEWRKKSALRQENPVIEKPAETEQPKHVETTEKTETETPFNKKHTVKALRDFATVKRIAELSGKKNSDVAAVINGLDEKSKYTIQEVVALLTKEAENVPQ